MDVYCQVCGEPWEVSHVQDEMKARERADFLAGQGCDACGWGTECPHCRGTGKQVTCATCYDSGRIIGTMLLDHGDFVGNVYREAGQWMHRDYRAWALLEGEPLRYIERRGECLGNHYAEAWFACPTCRPQLDSFPTCTTCGGTGKPVENEAAVAARASAMVSGGCLDDMAADLDGRF